MRAARAITAAHITPAAYSEIVANIESALSPAERISVTGDEWAQVRSNKATVGDYLDLAAALKSDENAEVVTAASGRRGCNCGARCGHSRRKGRNRGMDSAHVCSSTCKARASHAADDPNTDELRALLFGVLGNYGNDPAVLSQAKTIAEQLHCRSCIGRSHTRPDGTFNRGRHGDAKLFEKLQNVYETSTDPVRQSTALHLLARFEQPELVQRSMDFATSGKVRNQDAAIQISVSLGIPASRELAWNYIKSHWDKGEGAADNRDGRIPGERNGRLLLR